MRLNPKPKSRWKWLTLLAVPVLALAILSRTMNTSPPTNRAQTAPDAAPELQTRIYSPSVNEVYAAAQAVIGEQQTWFRQWRIVPQAEIHAGTPHHQIKVEVSVLFFTDDLTVKIDASNGKTRLNVESQARVGQGDFGENRRHVVQFLEALDERLQSSS